MKKTLFLVIISISAYTYAQNQLFSNSGNRLNSSKYNDEIIERTWHKNGQLEFEGRYKYGKKHGEHKWWYENGQLEFEENYKNGQKNGLFKGWWQNGQIDYVGEFKYNQRDGVWKAYYESGQLRQETDFVFQRKLSEKCFSENGDKMDCEESLEDVWWWKDEKCFDKYGDEIDCHEYYLGAF